MPICVAGTLAGLACWLAARKPAAGRRRLARLAEGRSGEPAARGGLGGSVARGGLGGRAARGGSGARGRPRADRWPATRRFGGGQPDAELAGAAWPAALDLLAACLCGGATLEQSLRSVARSASGSVRELLDDVGRLTTLGAPPETAWAAVLARPQCAAVGRAVIRAHHSGAALTDVLTRVADDRRRELRAGAQTAAARASVRAVLPLGACFLPAFALAGVVPVVAGFVGVLRA